MLPIILYYENEIVFLNIIPYANRFLNKYIFRLCIYIKYLMLNKRSGSRVPLKKLVVNFKIIVIRLKFKVSYLNHLKKISIYDNEC